MKLLTYSRRILQIILLLIIVLIIIRAYLPTLVQRYVNRKLDSIPDYTGRIGDVDLHLWRGAYSIQDIKLLKRNGSAPVPFFESANTDFSIQWKALFEGKVVGELEIDRPILNFVTAASTEKSQTEIDSEWLSVVKDLFPLRLNRFRVNSGEVHYRDFNSEPKVDLKLNQVTVDGTNLNNTRTPSEGQDAIITSNGKIQNVAPFNLRTELKPAAKEPTFNLKLATKELPVKELNDFLKAYAKLDAEKGTLRIDMETKCVNGDCRGYFKPITKDLEIFKLDSDLDNPLSAIWEGFAGLINGIFQNQRHGQVATEIKFSGTFDKSRVNRWRAIGSVLENAFIEALKPGFKGSSVTSKS